LTARQRARGLDEPLVAEPDVLQHAQPPPERRRRREEIDSLVDGERKHVADGLATLLHAEHLGTIAAALALLTGDVHILEEIHFELLEPVALARLASAARHVEGERARAEAQRLRARQPRVELADLVEGLHVGDRIAARGASDRLLVDEANALHVL